MSFVHLHLAGAAPGPRDCCWVFQGDRLLVRASATPAQPSGSVVPDRLRLPTIDELTAWLGSAKPLHIGRNGEDACWSIAIDDAGMVAPAGWEWQETRALLGLFAPDQSQAMSCARQLLWWERRHRFCGTCGARTVEVAQERARSCPACGALFFPSACPAVIVAVTRGDELLLAHNRSFRPHLFSLLAGFIDPGETAEQAAIREVREETGLEIGALRYVTSQPWSFPNSLMLGFRAQYLGGEIAVDGKEIQEAGWFRRDALPEIPRVGTVARLLIDRWRSE